MDEARKLGIRIPEDLSVMGFDDHSVTQLDAYNLTTVSHQREKLYQAVLQALDLAIEHPEKKTSEIFLMKINVRKTVKRKN